MGLRQEIKIYTDLHRVYFGLRPNILINCVLAPLQGVPIAIGRGANKLGINAE
jgi:hypothetical protein